MKKKQLAAGVIAVCILCISASEWEGSVWEGNAVVSTTGELPTEGLYGATNAFPRNTVVYITNLETEKTIPVTVVASLDNPGLLITLTREAAEAIGMPIGSLGRIKMIQPADPEAFSQYLAQKDRTVAEADPSMGVREAGAAKTPLPEKPSPPPAVAPPRPPEDTSLKDAIGIPNAYKPGTPAALSGNERTSPDPELTAIRPAEPASSGTNRPDVTAFPGAAEDVTVTITEKPEERLEQPETYLQGAVTATQPEAPSEVAESRGAEGLPVRLPPTAAEDLTKQPEAAGEEAETPDVTAPEAHPLSSTGTLTIQEKPLLETGVVNPETSLPQELPTSTTQEAEAPIQEKPSAEGVTIVERTAVPEGTRYNADAYRLVEAEERPPAERAAAELPPEAEIAPIPNAPLAIPAQTAQAIDPTFIIPPLANSQRELQLTPQIPPIPASPPLHAGQFSVPVISRLEAGKYYLQLGAYHTPSLVELELSKIGGTPYPVTIQQVPNAQNPARSLYRILLGPLNLGESDALLRRFKGIGYPDAFVRRGT
ncbi:MAG: SPOR domain-containing protein [Treponema sp.]|nr:SPOR domain-containing protein [Treponema sp.]